MGVVGNGEMDGTVITLIRGRLILVRQPVALAQLPTPQPIPVATNIRRATALGGGAWQPEDTVNG